VIALEVAWSVQANEDAKARARALAALIFAASGDDDAEAKPEQP